MGALTVQMQLAMSNQCSQTLIIWTSIIQISPLSRFFHYLGLLLWSHFLPTFILISSILQTLDYLDYKAHDSPQVWIIKVWPYSQLSGYTVRLKLYKNNYRKINHLTHQLHLRKLMVMMNPTIPTLLTDSYWGWFLTKLEQVIF